MKSNLYITSIEEEYKRKQKLYSITPLDRIRYHLHKQQLTLSKLLEQRNPDGSDRTAEERCIYNSFENKDKRELEKERYTRYLSGKLPQKAYLELCTRLRIDKEITEIQELKAWKKLLEKKELDFGSKTETKPSKAIQEKRQKLASRVSEKVKELQKFEDETLCLKELQQIKWEKDEFLNYALSIPQEVLYLWNKYLDFFDTDYISDICFFEQYMNMVENGKTVLHEMICVYFDGNEAVFSNEQINLYLNMKHLSIPPTFNIQTAAEEIWEKKHYSYSIEQLEWRKDLALLLLNSQPKDLETLADYHRFHILYADAENGTYVPFIEHAMTIILHLPFCKK